MYYDLYVSNKWVEPIEKYLSDPKLTDAGWYNVQDIIPAWRGANSVQGALYGVPFDGESTLQIYRKDLYDAKGLKPAETFDELVKNAAAVHDPANRVWGAGLRGFKGAGQNMYIYPSIFRAFGGEWTPGGSFRANSREAVAALEWYVELLSKYAPPAVRNWNWPDLADAFSQSTLGLYIDANTSASVLNNPERSKVLGKIGYARWPRGPSGKRVSSIWNWGFPINAALSERAKRATWLFIAWASSAETQARTSWKASGPVKRLGLNRLSLWQSKPFESLAGNLGANFLQASIESMRQDLDVDWRPRMPQWPAVGETLATAIQAALVGQQKPKEALDEAQARITQLLKT
jgi:ABC-type glycerol-3-phosphate transport system substrate-binding protein